jgi:hypothetical protein
MSSPLSELAVALARRREKLPQPQDRFANTDVPQQQSGNVILRFANDDGGAVFENVPDQSHATVKGETPEMTQRAAAHLDVPFVAKAKSKG